MKVVITTNYECKFCHKRFARNEKIKAKIHGKRCQKLAKAKCKLNINI